MTGQWHGGKGSAPRKEQDNEAYRNNYDMIFSSKKETKVCTKCETEKDIGSFWKRSEKTSTNEVKYRSVCIACSVEQKMKKYYQENGKEKQKARSFKALLKSYGIDEEIYEAERVKQGYKCLLCGDSEENQPHKRLVVDHCHETGKYRGLLCNLCNTGLGAFKDNTDVLQKAIEYLNETRIRHRNVTEP